jgi:hypothetical protein
MCLDFIYINKKRSDIMGFTKATKKNLKLRLAIAGPSGSGKTYSALAIGSCLGKRIAVIDTEHKSASRYSDIFDFDTVELEENNLNNYIKWIQEAEKEGYDVLIIDSLSHAWSGTGGALDMVEDKAKLMKSANSWAAWRFVTPIQNTLINTITGSKMHIIATMRVKTEYIVEDTKDGKKAPKKIGLAPIQKENIEHEFDIFGEMTMEHDMIISKSRIPSVSDKLFSKPGQNFAKHIIDWMNSGEIVEEPKKVNTGISGGDVDTGGPTGVSGSLTYITPEQTKQVWLAAKTAGHDVESCKKVLLSKGYTSFSLIPSDEFVIFSDEDFWAEELANG